jgi:predicted aldo/keto reductase-like oxidoreductase
MSMNTNDLLSIPKLGFGLMRLPKKNGEIDIEQVSRMADEFLRKGFTYFDTAYVYTGSEAAFREAVLKRHPRDSFTIATKMPSWVLEEKGDPEAVFMEQLERCGVDYFDFYLLHSIQPMHLPNYDKFGCWEFCRKMKEEGNIKHFGFSFHGSPELLEKILENHPEVEFVQLQINYIDWESGIVHSGRNYNICRERHIPVVIMEPIKGGILANLKPECAGLYQKLAPNASPASYALRFCGSLDGIMTVLSGMSNEEQMEDNLKTFAEFKPLSDIERAVMKQVKENILSVPTIGCTVCRYCCDGCPQKINIPEIFKSVNQIYAFGDHVRPHLYYEGMLASGETQKASDCIACGQCESVCPQHLEIVSLLQKASELLDK